MFSYLSLLWLFPGQEIGLFASLNGPCVPHKTGDSLDIILYFIADMLLGFEPWLDAESACTFPAPWKVSDPLNLPNRTVYKNDHLDDFVGVYGNNLLPDIRIETTEDDEENKKLRLIWNRIIGDLLPTPANNSFEFKMTDPWEYAIEFYITPTFPITFPVTFLRSKTGEVDSFNFELRGKVLMLFKKGITFINDCNTKTELAKELWSCDPEEEVDSGNVNVSNQPKMSAYLMLVSIVFILENV